MILQVGRRLPWWRRRASNKRSRRQTHLQI